jgi:phosphoadenosine phosphosulfate reductase
MMTTPTGSLHDHDPELSERELSELNARFERATASSVIEWAVEKFYPYICLTTSGADALLVDLAVKVEPSIEVVFIDTNFHFPETLATLELVRRRYGLNLRVMTVVPPTESSRSDGGWCCSEAKVAALNEALTYRLAWMSGLRRADSSTRAHVPIVEHQRGRVKVNPIAGWSDDDVASYITAHDVPVNPLRYQGFPSIGCWPCTQPVAAGGDPRSGRWPGTDKTECGMHCDPSTHPKPDDRQIAPTRTAPA